MPLQYPQINGVRYDFSSVDIRFNGTLSLVGLKSLNYKHGLKPGEMRGNRAHMIGRTRGRYEASGDFEMYKSEYEQLKKQLGQAYMEQSFVMSCTHSEPTLGPDTIITDELLGCRITDEENQKQEGEEPLTVKVSLSIFLIKTGGQSPVNTSLPTGQKVPLV